jgi:transposase
MDQYSGTTLEIPYFKVTKPVTRTSFTRGKDLLFIETIHGKVTTKVPKCCPHCQHKLLFNQYLYINLHHLTIGMFKMKLHVMYEQHICSMCARTVTQEIPFKESGHLITDTFYNLVVGLLRHCDATIRGIAHCLHTNWKLVKDIDKRRLTATYGDMKPTHYSPHLCVDEFSLHKGHQYATVVLDWRTGEILFLEEGNSEMQLLHFFEKVGYEWMTHVESISMDMNAQYHKAVASRYPHIAVVYDAFHIAKNFNDRILTELRRQEQRRLQEKITLDHKRISHLKMDARKLGNGKNGPLLTELAERNLDLKEAKSAYTTMKGSRFLIVSSREALKRKDEVAKAHNTKLYQSYESKGLSLPPGERKWSIRNVQRLDEVLGVNSALTIAYFLSDQLKVGLASTDEQDLRNGMKQWLALSETYVNKIPMLKSFNKMLYSRMDGIVSRVKFPISNGPLEGMNNMIKTTRRAAYGYRDQEYFFLKLWERSRKYIKKRSLATSLQQRLDAHSHWKQSHSFFP